MRRRKIDGYVECSAKNDTESVRKVFEKACKLGLSQIEGIKFEDDPEEDQTSGPQRRFCCIL